MKGHAIIYFLITFLLSTTCFHLARGAERHEQAVRAEPRLLASVEIERLMHATFSMRSLLADEAGATQPRAEVTQPRGRQAGLTLTLHHENGAVSFTPARPVLTAGQRVQVQGAGSEDIEVYPRDEDILSWHTTDSTLEAGQAGETEIIFIVNKTLHILPVQVRDEPAALLTEEDEPSQPATRQLADIPTPVASSGERHGTMLTRAQVAYRTVEIQVVDERTTDNARYPVSGMRVSLLGSTLRLRTDARGVVRIADVPDAARLLLKLHDPQGRYVPAVQEIFVRQEQARYRLTVRRDVSLSTMQTIVGRSQDARLASLCGVIAGTQGETGFAVESDVPADGAYYFNQLQLLAPQQQATGMDNRFCLFNVDPGPLTLFISDAEGQRRGVFTVGLAAGHHSEETFTLAEAEPYRSWLAVADDMHRPLHGHESEGLVDFVQMRLLGDTHYLPKVADGLLETTPTWHRGRSYAVTNDAEFEDTLYQLAATPQAGLVPLLLRGFIENTALLAEEVHDAALGSVVVEHGAQQGEDAAAMSLRLLDMQGNEMRTAWARQEGGVTRSVFLNLDYGVYQVIAQNADGYWLAAGTVVVYNETVSFLRTGAAVVSSETDKR